MFSVQIYVFGMCVFVCLVHTCVFSACTYVCFSVHNPNPNPNPTLTLTLSKQATLSKRDVKLLTMTATAAEYKRGYNIKPAPEATCMYTKVTRQAGHILWSDEGYNSSQCSQIAGIWA